jgi:hypothetical protein
MGERSGWGDVMDGRDVVDVRTSHVRLGLRLGFLQNNLSLLLFPPNNDMEFGYAYEVSYAVGDPNGHYYHSSYYTITIVRISNPSEKELSSTIKYPTRWKVSSSSMKRTKPSDKETIFLN